ncbi:hypothetical protein ACKKBG_A09460 [Auxenochlorella protothecoides x Auxenochlorella symbiontica]
MADYLGSTPTGDWPWQERARGGDRIYTLSTTSNAGVIRPSQESRAADFEALKQAALAELHPKKQRTAAVLPTKDGSVKVLDTRKMDRHTRGELLESLAEEDTGSNLVILQKLRARMDKAGIQPPVVVVRYQNLSVLTTIIVGDQSVPTLTNFVKRMTGPLLKAIGKAPETTSYPIIDNVSGVLRPGVLTLLLGPPGSGKTTLLKTLAGYNLRDPGLQIKSKELTYNGKGFHQFRVERSSAYISQIDEHFGELTVRETFDFSARCQASGYRTTIIERLAEAEKAQGIVPDPELDAFMKAAIYAKGKDASLQVDSTLGLLGLEGCADTVVGNAMLRGISGGQKKRVTTGELVVGPARVIFADEISTGLDSNTTYSIVKSIGNLAHVMDYTVLVGLLQPSPETFDLFDEVILISNGRIPYHGPRETVLEFFESFGFNCPVRRGVADFLQEVTTPSDQHKYWDAAALGKPFRYQTVQMIENRFAETPAWKSMAEELSNPYGGPEENNLALQTAHYAQKHGELLRANFWRQVVLLVRNKIFSIIRTTQVLIMALVVATVFWKEGKENVQDGNLFFGVMFYSLLYQLLGGISEMHILVERLPVMFRQRDAKFYPGWAFALPVIILRIPFSLIEATIWSLIVYWVVGFSRSVRFLMFWVQLFLANVWSVQMFVLIAAVARNDTIATAAGSFFLLIFINLSGFVLNTSDIPPWWLGGFWGNPFSYATRALAINEFTSSQWDIPDPVNGGTLGANVLAFRGFQSAYWWCWVAIGFIIGSFVLNACAFVAAITFLGAPHSKPTMTEEYLEEYDLARRVLSGSGRSDLPASVRTASRLAPGSRPASGPLAAKAAETGAAPGTAGAAGDGAPPPDAGAAGEGAAPPDADAGASWPPTSAPSPDVESNAPLGRAPSTTRRTSSAMLRPSERAAASFASGEAYRRGTALPFTQMVITFRDVCYSVPLPKDIDRGKADTGGEGPHAGQLRLLKNINGAFRPHVLTALMGASGAGKTTLMDVLAGRKTEGVITGDIRVNGHPKQDRTFARVMGYVEQTDIHIPQATVHEACQFSARLRLPTTVDAATREAFVEEVMTLVELDRLRGAFVGSPGVSGLSVEQRKRLTLAVELVANPSVVFMDEPTSGLDARAAGIVMGAVRNTVDTGRTVVCTIHQPSIDIFQTFDELLLLKPGGRTIYNGPMGDDSADLIAYFQAIPGVEAIKPRYNPANWMLEVSNPGNERRLDKDFSELYDASPQAEALQQLLAAEAEPREGVPDIDYSALHIAAPMEQFRVNLRRNFLMYWRLPEYNITRFASTILIALVFGSMFWRLGSDRTTVSGVLNIMGVIFSSTLFVGISNCLTVQHVISTQRTVFWRERAAGLYGVLPFAAAQQLVELPYILIQAVVYVSIVYWMIWFQRDAGAFFWFLFLFFLTLCYFTFFGVMAVSITPNVAFGNVFCSFFFGAWNLLCGFLIPEPAIPRYWVWFYYINPVAWSLYSLVIAQLKDFGDEYIVGLDGVESSIPDFLESYFNFKASMLGPSVAILFGYSVLFIAITVFALFKINYQSR